MSDYLRQALVVKAIKHSSSPPVNGSALAVLRQSVWSGKIGGGTPVKMRATHKEIYSLGVADMPPSSELVSILVETLSQRLGNVGVKAAWESIGVKGRTGEELMKRTSGSVSWPIWKTLRDAALEE